MGQYIIRRLLAAVPTLVIVSILISGLVRIVPGDVISARLEEAGFVDDEQLAQMRAELGIDRSFPEQYIDWAGHALRGDLGDSLWTGRSVLDSILERSRVSVQLAIMVLCVAVVLAIPLGVISAVKQDSWIDYAARLFSIAGLSIPDFWLATILLLVLSTQVGWLPEFRYFPPWEEPWRNFQALIFPALIVGYRYSAISARMTRSAMLEVMRQDYVRTARAKGLPERTIVSRHALRNALIPVITIMGSQLSNLIGGLVIIETVFGLPGMGTLALDSVIKRDYIMLQGVVMFIAVVYLSVNLIVDLSYAVLDPRIRYS